MSGKANGWARDQVAPCRNSKDVLKTLADYADRDGFAWPAVARLAGDCQVSERSVQRGLRALERDKLLVGFDVIDGRTGRSRTRVYWFPIASAEPTDRMLRAFEERVGGRVTRVSPSEGDMGVTGEGDTGVTGRVTRVSPLNELELELSDTDVSSACAHAIDAAYDRLMAVWPQDGLDRTNHPEARTAFAATLETVTADAMVSAAAEWVAAMPRGKGSFGAPGLHNWLKRRGYLGRLPERAKGQGLAEGGGSPTVGWSGPAEVRAVIVKRHGEAFAKNTIDRAVWSDGTLITGTSWAAKRLTEPDCRPELEAAGVKIIIWRKAA